MEERRTHGDVFDDVSPENVLDLLCRGAIQSKKHKSRLDETNGHQRDSLCWNRPLMTSCADPSTEPLVPSSANRN